MDKILIKNNKALKDDEGLILKYTKKDFKINGEMKKFELIESVKSGDFVEFVNNNFEKLSGVSQSCRKSECLLLNNGDIFIVHGYTSSDKLYGSIIKIKETIKENYPRAKVDEAITPIVVTYDQDSYLQKIEERLTNIFNARLAELEQLL
jgi:hypothetical protein